jgi:hypothetical protein
VVGVSGLNDRRKRSRQSPEGLAMALRQLRPDGLRGRRRQADELQEGANGGEVVGAVRRGIAEVPVGLDPRHPMERIGYGFAGQCRGGVRVAGVKSTRG